MENSPRTLQIDASQLRAAALRNGFASISTRMQLRIDIAQNRRASGVLGFFCFRECRFMEIMRNGSFARYFALLLGTGALICGLARAQAQDANALALDTPTEIGGIETVCTGVGLDSRGDSRWNTYSLKVELAGKGGQYLGDVRASVSKEGKTVLTVTCGGPWLLFKLPAARYQVDATIQNKTVSSAAYVPTTGQGRIILRFPELGGALEEPLKSAPENQDSKANYN